MAHTSRCSNSTSKRCRCSCGGYEHGGPAPTAGVAWGREVHLIHAHVETRLGPALKGAVVRIFARLFKATIESTDGKTIEDVLLDAAADTIADSLVDAIEPDPRERRRRKKRWRRQHVFCSIFVAVVQGLQELKASVPTLVEEAVRAAFAERAGIDLSAEMTAKAAGALTSKIQNALLGGAPEAYIRTCQLLAIASCPDPEQHPEVVIYCELPIAHDYLSAEVRGVLTRLVE
jgi:hypothetical protein